MEESAAREDADLTVGAESKVSINSSAVKRPQLINELADNFVSQFGSSSYRYKKTTRAGKYISKVGESAPLCNSVVRKNSG